MEKATSCGKEKDVARGHAGEGKCGWSSVWRWEVAGEGRRRGGWRIRHPHRRRTKDSRRLGHKGGNESLKWTCLLSSFVFRGCYRVVSLRVSSRI